MQCSRCAVLRLGDIFPATKDLRTPSVRNSPRLQCGCAGQQRSRPATGPVEPDQERLDAQGSHRGPTRRLVRHSCPEQRLRIVQSALATATRACGQLSSHELRVRRHAAQDPRPNDRSHQSPARYPNKAGRTCMTGTWWHGCSMATRRCPTCRFPSGWSAA
jgi:hypothetical protein